MAPSVWYIRSEALVAAADLLPESASAVPGCRSHAHCCYGDGDEGRMAVGRHRMAESLIHALGVLKDARVVIPTKASAEDLVRFHDADYISRLLSFGDESDSDSNSDDSDDDFNLVDDAPLFEGIGEHVLSIAGATLTACHVLESKGADIAINWCGGRHHASYASAAGFCYVNDVVLAGLRLQDSFGKVLILDIDVHHGDGTEHAFKHEPNVLCASFHQFSPGFYPGTGSTSFDVQNNCVNVAFPEGTGDAAFVSTFCSELKNILEHFDPRAIAMVIGADTLANDPLGDCSLTSAAIASCVRTVLLLKRKTLLLGGGGYNFPDTARTWALCTQIAIDPSASIERFAATDIPEHRYFECYGPSFDMMTGRK